MKLTGSALASLLLIDTSLPLARASGRLGGGLRNLKNSDSWSHGGDGSSKSGKDSKGSKGGKGAKGGHRSTGWGAPSTTESPGWWPSSSTTTKATATTTTATGSTGSTSTATTGSTSTATGSTSTATGSTSTATGSSSTSTATTGSSTSSATSTTTSAATTTAATTTTVTSNTTAATTTTAAPNTSTTTTAATATTTGASSTTGSTTTVTTATTTAGSTTTTSVLPITCDGIVPVANCSPGKSCFRNANFEAQDTGGYDIDFNVEIDIAAIGQTNPTTVANLYNQARCRWMDVIRGDLPSAPPGPPPPGDTCANGPPALIDDAYICIRDEPIDGAGGILGFAGQLLRREDGTTITGNVVFDTDDVGPLANDNELQEVTIHEMSHALGFGFDSTLVDPTPNVDGTFDYIGPSGLDVWRNDWGCTGPIAPGFPQIQAVEGGHWDEQCLGNEIMTPTLFFGVPNPLSRLTVAYMEDFGYDVNFDAADPFDPSGLPCCTPPVGGIAAPVDGTPPAVPDAARAAAVAFGKRVLKENQRPDDPVDEIEVDGTGAIYVGDQAVFVLVEQDGDVFVVKVTNDDEAKNGELV